MLVNFRVENFKSFKDLTEFSMESTKLKNLKDSNTFDIGNKSLLKSAAIFGPNASGKSSVFDAIKAMQSIVKNSIDIEKTKKYRAHPFLLNSKTEKKGTTFEIEFIVGSYVYRYGLKIGISSIIIKEWLYRKKLEPNHRFILLFKRKKEEISIGASFKEGSGLPEKTRANSLFLPVVAQFNGKISEKLLTWFNQLNVLYNLESAAFANYSYSKLDDEEFKEKIVSLVKSADTGIYSIIKKSLSFEELADQISKEEGASLDDIPDFILDSIKKDGVSSINTEHIKYNDENEFLAVRKFELDFESDGTQRLLALSAPIIDALDNGKVLVIDELDNSLHTDLVEAIVKLFNSSKTNINNAQLIFSTHDTNLLDQRLFRRDQIWFTQKDIFGKSDLYSLVEYGRRDDLALEKSYLQGKFGAVPHISTLEYEASTPK